MSTPAERPPELEAFDEKFLARQAQIAYLLASQNGEDQWIAVARMMRAWLPAGVAERRDPPEPVGPCEMNARCLGCQRPIVGCVQNSTCATRADCALKGYERALRGALRAGGPAREEAIQEVQASLREVLSAFAVCSCATWQAEERAKPIIERGYKALRALSSGLPAPEEGT